MAMRIDGKAVSTKVKEEVAAEVEVLKKQGVCPGLAVVIVGDDPASRIYVNNKKKACQQQYGGRKNILHYNSSRQFFTKIA